MTLRWAPAAALWWITIGAQLGVPSAGAQAEVSSAPELRSEPVVLDSDQCSSVARDELRELVALELAPRAVKTPSELPAGGSVTSAELRCSATRARLVVRDAARRQQQELALELTQIDPPARARLIALALAELIATVEMEPLAPARPAEPPKPAHSPSPRGAHSSWWLGAGLTREGRPRILAPSLQSGLALSLAALPLALFSELQLQRGERTISAGRVTAWTVSGSLGLAGQLHAGPSDLTLGLGLRLGYAELVGKTGAASATLSAHNVSGLLWGPTLGASAVLPLYARWGVRAGVDLTWLARGVRGTDSGGGTAFQLDGLLVHATLGVSLRLPRLRT